MVSAARSDCEFETKNLRILSGGFFCLHQIVDRPVTASLLSDVRSGAHVGGSCTGGSCAGRKPQQASPSFGPSACTATLVTWLLVVFSPPHLLLDARVFHQLSEPLDGIRDRFMLSQTQLDHKVLLFQECFDTGRPRRSPPCQSGHTVAGEPGPQRRRPAKIAPTAEVRVWAGRL